MNRIVLKNPITSAIKNSISKSNSRLNFAVPFISSFAISILNKEDINEIAEKKIITRFDDSFLNSFDLPTLKKLLDLGFEIKYDNNIHLKLYIIDNEAYITSANLTKGGFEDNVELTTKVGKENTLICNSIFKEIWNNCQDNKITYQIIEENYSKYKLLKKRDDYTKKVSKSINSKQLPILDLDIEQVIEAVFKRKQDYSKTLRLEYEANKLRERTKKELRHNFSTELFYVQDGHPKRKRTLFYDFVYGYEGQIAGTGLRESHFQSVFLHPEFENVLNYIFPERIGMKPWDFHDVNIKKEFCNGLFDFKIPSYKEAIPIRLATYFYPNFLLPIFKLDHLKKICEAFGFETDAETKGDRLFAYNSFLKDKMQILPYKNIIKAHIAYQVRYTVELLNRLKNNESYDEILVQTKKVWIKELIEEGKEILIELNKINKSNRIH